MIECEICGDKHALLCEFVDDTIYEDKATITPKGVR
jgi:hypothetical protein